MSARKLNPFHRMSSHPSPPTSPADLPPAAPRTAAAACLTQVRTATKKAGGSSKNGRKTAGRRLGLKRHDGTLLSGRRFPLTTLAVGGQCSTEGQGAALACVFSVKEKDVGEQRHCRLPSAVARRSLRRAPTAGQRASPSLPRPILSPHTQAKSCARGTLSSGSAARPFTLGST